ncbi:hypothetical protein [Paracoccus simplex]|uniref:Uncharacterized protein n=1 Tax=Paracoccus simplex TaxID=2086346 RepID=A0ABV7RZQ5_9RHOB
MPDHSLKPVTILPPDRAADWGTPPISGVGRDFHRLGVRHAAPGGGTVRPTGRPMVTGLGNTIRREDKVVVLCGGESWTGAAAPDLTEMRRRRPDLPQDRLDQVRAGTSAEVRR